VTPAASWRMPWMKVCGVTIATAVRLAAPGCQRIMPEDIGRTLVV
jgi:hypothetical protein